MENDPIVSAQAMLRSGRQADAISLIAHAADRGNALARFQQALWYLAGAPLKRDLALARQALRDAASAGHAEARLIEVALTANGSGAAPDWERALLLLETACITRDAHALHLRRLLGDMDLARDGRPSQPIATEDLVADGSVRYARALLSRAECAHVVDSTVDLLAPAVVVDPRTGRSVPHPIRTSDAAVLSPLREDPVIRAINLRIAKASDTQVDQGEALTILRYQPGQQFRMHSDVLPSVRNQRVATVLVYLNEGFTGGETVFPDHRLSIVPKAGDAVIFDNLDGSGTPIATARHAGAPVVHGVKWLATRWIRARPFDVWTGPESS